MEFRAYEDDSWYDVRFLGRGDTLILRYDYFPGEELVFKLADFQSLEKVQELRETFRPASQQLQDVDCSQVVEGIVVCASHSFGGDALHFYDAAVEEVKRELHSFEGGEEQCRCKFLLYWIHGSNEGNEAIKRVESICLVKSSGQIDPLLTSFLNTAKQQILDSNGHSSSVADLHAPRPESSDICKMKGKDSDLGANHEILIDNLEKDVSSTAIVEFIHKQTLIPTQAYVFHSLSSETYTRGVIMLSCGKNLQLLLCFLDDPNHLVISSRGRPWVLPERVSRHDNYGKLIGALMFKAQHKFQRNIVGSNSDLDIVYFGTKEYNTAKQLKDLFIGFAEHQKKLHKGLGLMEKKILSHPMRYNSAAI